MRWMEAKELAALWSNDPLLGPVPVATVRRWASEDRASDRNPTWPQTHGRPIRYDPDVAQAAFDRRRAARAEALGVSDHETGR